MKILLLAPQPFFQERGTPIAVKLLAETLGQAGHAVDLLTFHEGQDVTLPNTRILRIKPPRTLKNIRPGFTWQKIICDLFMALKCWQLTSRHRYDLTHAVEEAVFMAWGLKKLKRLPYIYDMDSSLSQQMQEKHPCLRILNPLFTLAEKIAVRSALGVIAVCPSLEDMACAYAPGKPILRLEDISLLPEGPVRPRDKLSISGKLAMYVGNLEAYQGLDLLLEGFQLAAQAVPDLQAVIIGGQPEDIKHYQDMAARLGVGGRTHFLGPRPPARLGEYLAQADFLLSPRLKGENTPMKIYSYMDSGKPVLATRLKTHTQVMNDKTAMLVEPNPQAWSQGLIRLAGDPKLCRALGRSAKKQVRMYYSRPVYQKKLLGFYDQMAEKLFPGKQA